jgi:hypothetical protein
MKRYLFFPALLLCIFSACFGQDSLKTNRIIYGDMGVGAGLAGIGGIEGSLSVNYQVKKSLFSLRLIGVQSFTLGAVEFSPFTAFPTIKDNGSLVEFAALYGRRFIDGGQSFSYSVGASFNDRTFVDYISKHQTQNVTAHYIGLPVEATFLWFKSKKKRYRIYYLVPVGKPTGFGKSIGFKFAGNISQHSYLSLGLVLGWGWLKQY